MAQTKAISVQIEGWDVLEAKLKAMAEHIDSKEVMEAALQEGATVVQQAITYFAPQRTGQLAASIEISEGDRVKYSLRVGPSGAGFYGRYLEYGTSKMSAHPFMRPAFSATQNAAELAIADAIWAAIEAAAR